MDIALHSSIYVSSPEFAGWLYKKGFRWRKLWRKRWVALHGAEIVYMEKEPTLENSATLKFTKAQITSSTVIVNSEIDGDENGFSIHINDGNQPIWYLRAESLREKKSWLMRLSHAQAIVQWLGDFEKVRVLGVGGTGIVYELSHKSSNQRFAMKEMEIKNNIQMQMAISEAEMLKDIVENVHHPNILQIERVFQVGSKFYLVFPLCTGGELYEYIIKRGSFTEHVAASLIREIISGLQALHQHDILHLDIKPENILFESYEENAKLKIIDFGLSKVLTLSSTTSENENDELDPTKKFSMHKMMENLTIFLETGQLYKQRLRGTIGYMSPEYILTGYVSKASDVYAVGVILYILLCGKPPYHSNSMRDMLEQSTKGSLSLKGPEWDLVSVAGKDLVREMLTSNPLERITTENILLHPWIEQLDEVDVSSSASDFISDLVVNTITDATTNTTIKTNTVVVVPPTIRKQHSNNKLDGAVRQLSGYVKQLRSEKLATTLTRLVSSFVSNQQHDSSDGSGRSGNKSTLADRFLVTTDTTTTAPTTTGTSSGIDVNPDNKGISNKTTSESSLFLVLSSQFRTALAGALSSLDEISDGKLTIRQFSAIIMQLIGYADQSVSLTTVIMGKLVDRDGDGFITADDIFTLQAMILQRSDVVLRQIIFRVYTEALWYPGKQVNLLNAKQQITSPRKSSISDVGGRLSTGTPINIWDNTEQIHFVDPPKYITAKHVASVFEKLGYDPNHGTQVFVILCEALNKIKLKSNNNNNSVDSQVINNNKNNNNELNQLLETTTNTTTSSSSSPSLIKNSLLSSTTSGDSNNKKASNISNLKMDVNDFIKCIEIDDVLFQALTRRARSKMLVMMHRAEEIFLLNQQQQQCVSNNSANSHNGNQHSDNHVSTAGNNNTTNNSTTTTSNNNNTTSNNNTSSSRTSVRSITDIASDILAKEFKLAFQH